MNTQYPAGTGFDLRFQRPQGVNVGGVGNLYAPQPQPEEQEEGVNPLAVIAGLAAAGGLATAGILGARRAGWWGKGKPTPGTPIDMPPPGMGPGPAPSAGPVSSADIPVQRGPAGDFSRPVLPERIPYDQGVVNRRAMEAEAARDRAEALQMLKQGKPLGAREQELANIQNAFGIRNYALDRAPAPVVESAPRSVIPADLFSKRGSTPTQDYGNYIAGIIRENGRNLDTVSSTGRIGNLFADLSLTGIKKTEDIANEQIKALADEGVEAVLEAAPEVTAPSADEFLANVVGSANDTAEEYIPVDPKTILNKGSNLPLVKKTQPIRYERLEDVDQRAIQTTDGKTYHIYKIDKDNNVAIGINPETDELDAFEIVPPGGRFIAKSVDLAPHKDIIAQNAARRSQLETIAQEQAEEARQIIARNSPANTPEAPLPSGEVKIERLPDDQVELPYGGYEKLGDTDKGKFFIQAYSEQLGKRVPILKPEVALAAAAESVHGIPTELAKEIAKIPLGATERELSNQQKGVLKQAFKYVDQSLRKMPAQVVLGNIEQGGLVAGDRKSAAPGMPGKTELVEWTPGQTQLQQSGKRAPARYASSALERIIRGTNGEVDYKYKFGVPGVDGAQGEFANANTLLDPVTVAFAPNPDTDQLVLISNQGQGSTVVPLRPYDRAPDEEVIGQTDSDVITKEDRIANLAPDPTIFRLAEIAKTGRTLVDPTGMVDNSKRRDKNVSGFNPLTVFPNTAGGILQAIAAGKLKLSSPEKGAPVPFVSQSGRQVHNSGSIAAVLGAEKASIGNYAPGGLTKSGVKIDRVTPVITAKDRQKGQEFLDLIGQMDIEQLGDKELAFLSKEGFDINPGSARAQTNAATLASLLRSINTASENANAKGEEVNRIIRDGLSPTGVAIGRALPNLASVSDFYGSGKQIDTKKSKLRTKGLVGQDSIPAATQQIVLEDPAVIQEAYRQALGYVPGPAEDSIARVLQGYGSRSPIKVLTTSSGDVRKEIERLQAPTAPIDASLTAEIEDVLDQLPPKFAVTSVADLKKKQTSQTAKNKRYKEQQRLRMRENAQDSLISGLAAKAEADDYILELAAEEKAEQLGNRSVFDLILKAINDGDDKELGRLTSGSTTKGNTLLNALEELEEVEAQQFAETLEDPSKLSGEKRDDYVYGRPAAPTGAKPKTVNEALAKMYLKGTPFSMLQQKKVQARPVVVTSKAGRATLDYTNDSLDTAARSRMVVDPEAVAAGATGDDAKKWVGGSPLKPSPRTTFDYTTPVPVRTHWQDRAENDPNSIYGYGSRLGMQPNELFTALKEDPEGLLFDLEEKVEQNPGSIDADVASRIKSDPQEFMRELLDQSRKIRDVQPNYSYQEKGGVPARTAQQLAVNLALQKQGLPISREIQDAVLASGTEGYKWAGNSVIDLKGRIAADTLSDIGGTASMKLRIARPDKEDSYFGEGKEAVSSLPPHERLQKEFGIYLGTQADKIDPTMDKLEAIDRGVSLGYISADKAEKMKSDPRITSELLQTKFWELRPGKVVSQNFPIEKQIQEAVRRGNLTQEEAQQRFELLVQEDKQLRPGAYGQPVSTILPREIAEKQREANAATKAEEKRQQFSTLLSKVTQGSTDEQLSQLGKEIELGKLERGSVSGDVLTAINSLLGTSVPKGTKLNPGTLQRVIRAAVGPESEKTIVAPQYEKDVDGAVPTPAVEFDPYDSIYLDDSESKRSAQREKVRSQQAQTASDAISALLGRGAEMINRTKTEGNTRFPVISPQYARQYTGRILGNPEIKPTLLRVMDATGLTPTALSQGANQKIRQHGRSIGIYPFKPTPNTTKRVPNGIQRGLPLGDISARSAGIPVQIKRPISASDLINSQLRSYSQSDSIQGELPLDLGPAQVKPRIVRQKPKEQRKPQMTDREVFEKLFGTNKIYSDLEPRQDGLSLRLVNRGNALHNQGNPTGEMYSRMTSNLDLGDVSGPSVSAFTPTNQGVRLRNLNG